MTKATDRDAATGQPTTGQAAPDARAGDPLIDDPLVYEVTLHPHRSLSQSGFRVVMITIGAASFASGAAFLAMGAWPVFGFFGLDVLLIYLAFRANFRDARAREHIRVTASLLEVEHITARGARWTRRLNPFWTRLWRQDDEDHGTLDLALVSGRQTVPVGRFLGPPQKAVLADELSRALSAVKKGVARNSF